LLLRFAALGLGRERGLENRRGQMRHRVGGQIAFDELARGRRRAALGDVVVGELR
jgi:hypothetical protein